MAKYDYTPLDEEAGEITLLKLLPGHFNAPVRITIRRKVLSAENTPEFEALSYAWGSPSDRLDISVEAKLRVLGVKPSRLSITRNLFEALRHLRQEHRSRVLWIDQICVDQRNLEERGNQVLRMPDIYSLAQGVIVWLGPESDDSNLAMTVLNDIGQDVTVDWGLWESHVDPSSTFDFDGLRRSSQQWLSITNLLCRSWFERLWVVQEICLTKKWVCMVCGFKRIPSTTFGNAIFYLGENGYCNNATQSNILSGTIKLFRLKVEGGFKLEWVLNETRHRKCSDKKDRVYAVLSLLPERKRLGIHPDYTISAPDVFENIVLQQLKYDANLSMLCFCSTKDRSRDIPSWVPDWSTDHKIRPFQIVSANLDARAHAYSVSKGVLAVKGVCVTVVHEIKNDFPRSIPEDRTESAKVFRQLLSTWVGQDHSDSNLSKLHSLCVTLCAGLFSEKYIPSNHSWPTYKDEHNYLTRLYEISLLESAEPPELCSSSLRVIRTINMMTRGRLLITTADGRLGLAPEGTLSGDLVSVILGCGSPLILRSNNSLNYEVVGECYIDGIMAGETLLGELPRNWMLVSKYFPKHRNYFHVLVDSATRKTQAQDPRLGPLPAGWRIKNHEEYDAFNWYVNDITGEDAGVWDPRLEPDALRARGVEVQEFRLV